MKALDLKQRRFGRLVALSATHVVVHVRKVPHKRRAWTCACDCGAHAVVQTQKLLSGHTQSCGCLMRERSAESARITSRKHGQYKSPEYRVWRSMLVRCYLPTVRGFKHWGGRGIRVCDRWRFGENGTHPFECFLEDVGKRPSLKHSIDRYPNKDGHYEPGNVRWATPREQVENRRPFRRRYDTQAKGERHPCAILTDERVISIRKSHAKGIAVATLARNNRMSEGAVRSIVKGRTWKHLLKEHRA